MFQISKKEQSKTIKKPKWHESISKLDTINDTNDDKSAEITIKYNSDLLVKIHNPIISHIYQEMILDRLSIEETIILIKTNSSYILPLVNKINKYNESVIKLKSLTNE